VRDERLEPFAGERCPPAASLPRLLAKKLHWSIGLDVMKHYENLHQFCQRAGFEDEAAWIARRLKEVRNDGSK
jgi:hypothetical protein